MIGPTLLAFSENVLEHLGAIFEVLKPPGTWSDRPRWFPRAVARAMQAVVSSVEGEVASVIKQNLVDEFI